MATTRALDDIAALLRSAGACVCFCSSRAASSSICPFSLLAAITPQRHVLAATKKRLEGVSALTAALTSVAPPSGDALAALLPDVLPCLRDNNAKVAALALTALEAALPRVPEPTVLTYLKVLWLNLVERLGDSKVQSVKR